MNVAWLRILKTVIEVYLKNLPGHLPRDANELLLFGASKLKEILFKLHATNQKPGIRLPVGKEFFLLTITYRIGVHTASLLTVPRVISIRVEWSQRETYYSFYSNGLSRWYIMLTHSTPHTYGTSYPGFVHRFFCKENTQFWLLDLHPPSSEGMGPTYLVSTLLSPLLIWVRDSAMLNYLAGD